MIVFDSDRDFNQWNQEIYVMDIEGGNLRSLSKNPSYDSHPSWSPDGQRIVFDSERNGNREIYVMDANGKNQRRVTNNPSWDGDPEWSPSGEKIVFMSERDGNKEIYVIDADGKNPRNLTKNSAFDGSAYWFDPAFAIPVTLSGKLRWLWRWLKQER